MSLKNSALPAYEDSWYKNLGGASVLDTSQILYCSSTAMEKSSSFATVVRRTAEATKTTVLTEVLQAT